MSMGDIYGAVPKPRRRATWLWSALAGFAVGGAIASGVFLPLMHQQQRRHEAEIVAITGVAAAPGALIGQVLGAANTPKKSSNNPLHEDIINYLDGETLTLPEGQARTWSSSEKSQKSCVIKKEGIELLETSGGASINGGPWNTSFTFLYKDSENARYGVEASVEYRQVGQRAVFFGRTINRVAKQ